MIIVRSETDELMSQAVVWGGVVYLSGQVGDVGFAVDEQTRQALDRIDRLLKSVGSDKSKILSTQIWLTDIGDFETMNAIWKNWLPAAAAPARATCQTTLAGLGYLVEITVVAAV